MIFQAFTSFNPAIQLFQTMDLLTKNIFCKEACSTQNYTDPKCKNLFQRLDQENVAELKRFCYLSHRDEAQLLPAWLDHFLVSLAYGFAYLILFIIIQKILERRSAQEEERNSNAQPLLRGNNLDSQSDIQNSEDDDWQSKPSQEKKPAIFVNNLGKTIQGKTVLQDINLIINKQEVLCLLGQNESGKSTFLQILTGFQSQTHGSIKYVNENVQLMKEKPRISFCPQETFAFPDNTVLENLRFFARIQGLDGKIPEQERPTRIKTVLERTNLTNFQDVVVSKLYQEQIKKLNMAIALLNDPQIIFMDEPTTGLDITSREAFWGVIKKLKAEKKAIVFTTQVFEDAEELADRVAILSRGKIEDVGSLSSLKRKFGKTYNLSIFSSKESLKRKAEEIKKTIQAHIPFAEPLQYTASDVMKYTLSSAQNEKLPALFKDLEKIKDIQFSIKMPSLRETFDNYERDRLQEEPNAVYDLMGQSVTLHLNNQETRMQIRSQSQFRAILEQRIFKRATKMGRLVFYLILVILVSTIVYIMKKIGEKEIDKLLLQHLWFFVIFCGLIKMTFTLHSLIKDRETNKTHAMKVMGLRPSMYWLANLLYDTVSILPIIFSCLIISQKIKETAPRKLIFIFFSALVVSLNVVVYSYNLARHFKNSKIFLLVSFLLVILSWGTAAILIENLSKYIFFMIRAFLSFIPQTYLFLGVIVIIDIEKGLLSKTDKYQVFDVPQVLISVLITFLYVIYKDTRITHTPKATAPSLSETPSATFVRSIENELDQSLEDERNMLSSNDLNKYMIKFQNVRKTYSNAYNHALSETTFGVEKGQVFCLVGLNKSGKSTIFDIITRKISPTSGQVFLNSQELTAKNYKPDLSIGLCPQTDTLWKELTVSRHLGIYAKLKGIPRLEMEASIMKVLEGLELLEHKHRRVRELSAGTRRKLCVALAILGAPKLIILDEPTKGVDSRGRRQIWSLLKEMAVENQSTVLVSTHHMEDAELVADKIGIMVEGDMIKIGTINDIRKENSFYYLVIDRVKKEHAKAVKDRIKAILPKVQPKEKAGERKITYKVPRGLVKSEFASIFRLLEDELAQKTIGDFSFSDISLNRDFRDRAITEISKRRENERTRTHSFHKL